MRGLVGVGGWAGGGRDRYYRLYLGIHSQSSAVFKCFTKIVCKNKLTLPIATNVEAGRGMVMMGEGGTG